MSSEPLTNPQCPDWRQSTLHACWLLCLIESINTEYILYIYKQVNPIVVRENTQAFYWRRTLFPVRTNCSQQSILPQKPTQIPIENIIVETDIFVDLITIIVNWGPPQHTNGNLTSYDVCISENELEGEEDCDVFSLFNVLPDVLTFEQPQIIESTQLAVQVYNSMCYILEGHMLLYYCCSYLMSLLRKCHTFIL